MPPSQTKEVIERELNAPLEDVFEWIDLEKPLGSASISQVTVLLLPMPDRPQGTYDHSTSASGQIMQNALHYLISTTK